MPSGPRSHRPPSRCRCGPRSAPSSRAPARGRRPLPSDEPATSSGTIASGGDTSRPSLVDRLAPDLLVATASAGSAECASTSASWPAGEKNSFIRRHSLVGTSDDLPLVQRHAAEVAPGPEEDVVQADALCRDGVADRDSRDDRECRQDTTTISIGGRDFAGQRHQQQHRPDGVDAYPVVDQPLLEGERYLLHLSPFGFGAEGQGQRASS